MSSRKKRTLSRFNTDKSFDSLLLFAAFRRVIVRSSFVSCHNSFQQSIVCIFIVLYVFKAKIANAFSLNIKWHGRDWLNKESNIYAKCKLIDTDVGILQQYIRVMHYYRSIVKYLILQFHILFNCCSFNGNIENKNRPHFSECEFIALV